MIGATRIRTSLAKLLSARLEAISQPENGATFRNSAVPQLRVNPDTVLDNATRIFMESREQNFRLLRRIPLVKEFFDEPLSPKEAWRPVRARITGKITLGVIGTGVGFVAIGVAGFLAWPALLTGMAIGAGIGSKTGQYAGVALDYRRPSQKSLRLYAETVDANLALLANFPREFMAGQTTTLTPKQFLLYLLVYDPEGLKTIIREDWDNNLTNALTTIIDDQLIEDTKHPSKRTAFYFTEQSAATLEEIKLERDQQKKLVGRMIANGQH